MPIDKGTSKPITQFSGLQINYRDNNSTFNFPIVTTEERDGLVNTDDPKKPIKDGTHIFNIDTGYEEYYSSTHNTWIEIKQGGGGGSGDVTGPASSVENNLVAFTGKTGKEIKDSNISTDNVVTADSNGEDKKIAIFDGNSKKIKSGEITSDNIVTLEEETEADIIATYRGNEKKLKNSRVLITTIEDSNANNTLIRLSNINSLQFGNSTSSGDGGTILVDSLTPVTFQTQGSGVESRVCTVINGEEGAGSSSPSALLEINSTEGGLLHARLTTAQRDALLDPKDGLEIYNTDTGKLNIRSKGAWVEEGGGGGGGGIVGPTISTQNAIAVWGDTKGSSLLNTNVKLDANNNLNGLASIGVPKVTTGPDSGYHVLTVKRDPNSTSPSPMTRMRIDSSGNSELLLASGSQFNNYTDILLTAGVGTTAFNGIKTTMLSQGTIGTFELKFPHIPTGDVQLTLPASVPNISGQILGADTSGKMSWMPFYITNNTRSIATLKNLDNTNSTVLTITYEDKTSQASYINLVVSGDSEIRHEVYIELYDKHTSHSTILSQNLNQTEELHLIFPSNSPTTTPQLLIGSRNIHNETELSWQNKSTLAVKTPLSSAPYTVEDGDEMITGAVGSQIMLPDATKHVGRELFFKQDSSSQLEMIIIAFPNQTIDNKTTITLGVGEYLHLVASSDTANGGKWHILAASQDLQDLNPTFETITCTKGPSTLKDVVVDGILTAKRVNCNGIGKFDYLESDSLIVHGQVIADDISTKGGIVAEDTIDGGTIVSKGDITAASDLTAQRLNLKIRNQTYLTLQANVAQQADLTFILPPNTGKSDQVLSTDGYGNLRWVDNVINNYSSGKEILNGTTGAVIYTSAITSKSIVSITRNVGEKGLSDVIKIGNLAVGSIIDGVSFTVYSSTEYDNDGFDWFILNP